MVFYYCGVLLHTHKVTFRQLHHILPLSDFLFFFPSCIGASK